MKHKSRQVKCSDADHRVPKLNQIHTERSHKETWELPTVQLTFWDVKGDTTKIDTSIRLMASLNELCLREALRLAPMPSDTKKVAALAMTIHHNSGEAKMQRGSQSRRWSIHPDTTIQHPVQSSLSVPQHSCGNLACSLQNPGKVWQSHFLKVWHHWASHLKTSRGIPRLSGCHMPHCLQSLQLLSESHEIDQIPGPTIHNSIHTFCILLFCLSLWGTGITDCNIGLTKVRQRSGWNLLHLLALRCRRACYEAQRCSKNKLRAGNECRKCEQMRAVTIY